MATISNTSKKDAADAIYMALQAIVVNNLQGATEVMAAAYEKFDNDTVVAVREATRPHQQLLAILYQGISSTPGIVEAIELVFLIRGIADVERDNEDNPRGLLAAGRLIRLIDTRDNKEEPAALKKFPLITRGRLIVTASLCLSRLGNAQLARRLARTDTSEISQAYWAQLKTVKHELRDTGSHLKGIPYYNSDLSPTGFCEVIPKDLVCAYCCGDGLLLCSACKVAAYCSKPCQKSHWKKKHKRHCEHLKGGVVLLGLRD